MSRLGAYLSRGMPADVEDYNGERDQLRFVTLAKNFRRALRTITSTNWMRTRKFAQVFNTIMLEVMCIERSVNCYYDRRYGARYRENLYKSLDDEDVEPMRHCGELGSLHSHRVTFSQAPDASHWNWRGVPKCWPLLSFYKIGTSIWMLYIIVKTTLGWKLSPWIQELTGRPGHCVLLGRLVFHPDLSAHLAYCFSISILLWPILQRCFAQNYQIPTSMFMQQTGHDLRRFLAVMLLNRDGVYLVPTDHLRVGRRITKVSGMPLGTSLHEQFFRELMCFKVRVGDRILYKLRPNRTLESRTRLYDLLSISFVALIVFVAFALLTLGLTSLIVCLSDLYYVQTYPGCDPHMDHLYASGLITSPFSFSTGRHHLLASVFNVVECWVCWGDGGLLIVLSILVALLMNYDIMSYGRHLHSRLETLLSYVTEERLRFEENFSSSALVLARGYKEKTSEKLEKEFNELHFELIDFFLQIEQQDKLMGDLITGIIIAWLHLCTIYSYYYATSAEMGIPYQMIAVAIVALIMLSTPAYFLFELHHCCMRTHDLLNKLNASIESGQTKRKFLRIFEFFGQDRNLSGYRMFRKYTTTDITYITVFGWSISTLVMGVLTFSQTNVKPAMDPAFVNQIVELDVLRLGDSKYSIF